MDEREAARIEALFPVVGDLTASGRDGFFAAARPARVGAGAPLAHVGDVCERIMLVLDGEVRVHRASPSGRDLTLYRIGPGQTCILTAMCMMADREFPAQADAVVDSQALVLPRGAFERLLTMEPAWRQFVLGSMSERMSDLFALIDSVVFTDLPSRLAEALLRRERAGFVALTHEQLASEVGSSREVVSRVLKGWERRGIVELSRGSLAIVSRSGLERMAGLDSAIR